jgi:hypothetical protein
VCRSPSASLFTGKKALRGLHEDGRYHHQIRRRCSTRASCCLHHFTSLEGRDTIGLPFSCKRLRCNSFRIAVASSTLQAAISRASRAPTCCITGSAWKDSEHGVVWEADEIAASTGTGLPDENAQLGCHTMVYMSSLNPLHPPPSSPPPPPPHLPSSPVLRWHIDP